MLTYDAYGVMSARIASTLRQSSLLCLSLLQGALDQLQQMNTALRVANDSLGKRVDARTITARQQQQQQQQLNSSVQQDSRLIGVMCTQNSRLKSAIFELQSLSTKQWTATQEQMAAAIAKHSTLLGTSQQPGGGFGYGATRTDADAHMHAEDDDMAAAVEATIDAKLPAVSTLMENAAAAVTVDQSQKAETNSCEAGMMTSPGSEHSSNGDANGTVTGSRAAGAVALKVNTAAPYKPTEQPKSGTYSLDSNPNTNGGRACFHAFANSSTGTQQQHQQQLVSDKPPTLSDDDTDSAVALLDLANSPGAGENYRPLTLQMGVSMSNGHSYSNGYSTNGYSGAASAVLARGHAYGGSQHPHRAPL